MYMRVRTHAHTHSNIRTHVQVKLGPERAAERLALQKKAEQLEAAAAAAERGSTPRTPGIVCGVCVCVCVCLCVCACMCVCVCICLCPGVWVHLSLSLSLCLSVSVSVLSLSCKRLAEMCVCVRGD
jgi:hypothetical protein